MPRQTAHILAFLCSVCLCNITLFSNFASRFFFFPQKKLSTCSEKDFCRLDFSILEVYNIKRSRSGEMADALDSKSGASNGMRVRVPPSAPFSASFLQILPHFFPIFVANPCFECYIVPQRDKKDGHVMKTNGVRKSRKRMSQLRGNLRQKVKGGPYYYRLMIANGQRKEFALKTCDREEAFQKAADLDAVWEAPTKDVAIAQISAIKGFTKSAENLPLSEIWGKYEVHPDRAKPLTQHEPLMYRSTLQEFIDYAEGRLGNENGKRKALSGISEVSADFVTGYVDYLKTTRIAVDTHNRKLRRLRKIFECLKDYCGGENPFRIKNIFRNQREEQGTVVRRLAF